MFYRPQRTILAPGLLLWLAIGMPLMPAPRLPAEPPANPAVFSQLWGRQGELWDPAGRLPDFSYAGYGRGEQPLPEREATASVTDFGAVGDDVNDDSAAFQRALREAAGQVIHIPAGTYLISDILYIEASGTVLRGDGPAQTRLRMNKPLNEIQPNWGATTGGRRTSNYSWSGGFLWARGQLATNPLADVAAPAERGSRQLTLSSVANISVGDEVRLVLRDDADQSLARYLYQGDAGPIDNLKRTSVSFVARIERVDSEANRVEVDRPLTTDVQLKWSPTVYMASSTVEEVGVERLGFEFPNRPYQGHFTEVGFNAIVFSGTRNCWVRDVHVHNSDSGMFISGINTTLTNIVFTSERRVEPSGNATGHHGVTLGGHDNLLSEFDFRTRFIHDITVSRGSSGNVAMRGRGVDLCFDHHRYAPHTNLFTHIDIGAGTRMFQSGGGAALGRHSAAWETFWGIQSQRPLSWPDRWGPELMNLVGLPSNEPAVMQREGRWFEPLDPERLRPRNLYQAQLQKRLETLRISP